jgi:hypothetical protein
MNIKKTIKKKEAINLKEYVNISTGELLDSELKSNVSMTLNKDTNQFTISSDEYVTFDADAIYYLAEHLNATDRGKVMLLANMVKGDCCVLYQRNNHPHTPETLSVTFEMHIDRWYDFVRKMVKKNILSYCVCAPSGYLQKIYMLNPYIARKRKTINCEISNFFSDITKIGKAPIK